jgi:hypothetical protein
MFTNMVTTGHNFVILITFWYACKTNVHTIAQELLDRLSFARNWMPTSLEPVETYKRRSALQPVPDATLHQDPRRL